MLAHLPNQIAYKGLHHKACMAFCHTAQKKGLHHSANTSLQHKAKNRLATQSQKLSQ
jgi:hypothetical protein